ncbi:hypothetical protein F2Q68_00039934 [Brassica cretica]|uniref:Uncharacterized protein n=1 Tax=Brassica cretica TaxID=69181 RepID=A0A8S9MFW3_BRACR|nr:hypothetical protein F2Q68_00039934 [Brassica cretica]
MFLLYSEDNELESPIYTTGSDLYRVSRDPWEKQGVSPEGHAVITGDRTNHRPLLAKCYLPLLVDVSRPWSCNSVCRPETSRFGVVDAVAQLSRHVVTRLRGRKIVYGVSGVVCMGNVLGDIVGVTLFSRWEVRGKPGPRAGNCLVKRRRSTTCSRGIVSPFIGYSYFFIRSEASIFGNMEEFPLVKNFQLYLEAVMEPDLSWDFSTWESESRRPARKP